MEPIIRVYLINSSHRASKFHVPTGTRCAGLPGEPHQNFSDESQKMIACKKILVICMKGALRTFSHHNSLNISR